MVSRTVSQKDLNGKLKQSVGFEGFVNVGLKLILFFHKRILNFGLENSVVLETKNYLQ